MITFRERIRFLSIDAPVRSTSNKQSISEECSPDNARTLTGSLNSRRRVLRLHDRILNPILGYTSRLKRHLNDRESKD